MKGKVWIWVGLGVVVHGGLAAVSISKSNRSKITPVQMALVHQEDITSRVKAPGKIEPKTQVKISADIMGKITHLLVKEGDPVRKGQLMLQLDDTQYRSLWEQSRAAAASARTRLRDSETQLRLEESAYARQKSLFEQKLLSQAEWEQAERTRESVRSTASSAQEDMTRADAAVRATADNLNKTSFHAPFDGVVSALNVEQGEIVITGTMNNIGTQILTVSDLSRMLVRADVDETDVVDMRVGQKAKISVDALPDTTFEGTVTEVGNTAKRSITSTVEGQTNFEVKVVFDHNVPQVRPGMTADVEIDTGTHPQVLTVPIQSVVVRTQRELDRAAKSRLGGGASAATMPKSKPKTMGVSAEEDTVGRKDREITGVFVVRNNAATFVPVRTGLTSQTMIEVMGELKKGDTVVSGPYKSLRELKPGGKVRKDTGTGAKK
jgi:HlyD family secretion protein